jgi:hypothetical protein
MEEVGESKGGRGSYIDKMWNRQAPLPPPTTPLLPVHASRLRTRLHFRRKTVQNHVSPFNYAGRRRGEAIMPGPLVNGSSQTVNPFQFPFIDLLHGRGAFFNFQPSSPSSTSILIANFIPRRLQLQSSLPTSSLVTNFNTRCLQLQPSSPRFSISSPSPSCPRCA